MRSPSHNPHGGARARLASGVAGLTVALGLLVVGSPLVAHAATVHGASEPFVVYLVLPSDTAGLTKSTAAEITREELSDFSLSTTAPASGTTGSGKVATSGGSATATMGINKTTVLLVTSVAKASKLALDVDFYNSVSNTLVFSYEFTNAMFTSYLLQDGSSGESVQVTFVYQKLGIDYISSTQSTNDT